MKWSYVLEKLARFFPGLRGQGTALSTEHATMPPIAAAAEPLFDRNGSPPPPAEHPYCYGWKPGMPFKRLLGPWVLVAVHIRSKHSVMNGAIALGAHIGEVLVYLPDGQPVSAETEEGLEAVREEYSGHLSGLHYIDWWKVCAVNVDQPW